MSDGKLLSPSFRHRFHWVRAGDRLWFLAGLYFRQRPYAAQLWYVIADFQVADDGTPAPIHDPTIALKPGSKLVIPSLRTLDEEILNEARRQENDA